MRTQPDLPIDPPQPGYRPLADRMRPRTLAEFTGQPVAIGSLDLSLDHHAAPTDPRESGAAAALLDSGNPVRFVLPLLARIERADPCPVVLGLPGGGRLRAVYESARAG